MERKSETHWPGKPDNGQSTPADCNQIPNQQSGQLSVGEYQMSSRYHREESPSFGAGFLTQSQLVNSDQSTCPGRQSRSFETDLHTEFENQIYHQHHQEGNPSFEVEYYAGSQLQTFTLSELLDQILDAQERSELFTTEYHAEPEHETSNESNLLGRPTQTFETEVDTQIPNAQERSQSFSTEHDTESQLGVTNKSNQEGKRSASEEPVELSKKPRMSLSSCSAPDQIPESSPSNESPVFVPTTPSSSMETPMEPDSGPNQKLDQRNSTSTQGSHGVQEVSQGTTDLYIASQPLPDEFTKILNSFQDHKLDVQEISLSIPDQAVVDHCQPTSSNTLSTEFTKTVFQFKDFFLLYLKARQSRIQPVVTGQTRLFEPMSKQENASFRSVLKEAWDVYKQCNGIECDTSQTSKGQSRGTQIVPLPASIFSKQKILNEPSSNGLYSQILSEVPPQQSSNREQREVTGIPPLREWLAEVSHNPIENHEQPTLLPLNHHLHSSVETLTADEGSESSLTCSVSSSHESDSPCDDDEQQ